MLSPEERLLKCMRLAVSLVRRLQSCGEAGNIRLRRHRPARTRGLARGNPEQKIAVVADHSWEE